MKNCLLFVGLLTSLFFTTTHSWWHYITNLTNVPIKIQFGISESPGYDEAYKWEALPKVMVVSYKPGQSRYSEVKYIGSKKEDKDRVDERAWTNNNCLRSIKIEGTGRLAGRIVEIKNIPDPCRDFNIWIEEVDRGFGTKVLQVSVLDHENTTIGVVKHGESASY